MQRFKKFVPLLIVGIVVVLGAMAYLAIEHYGLDKLISTVGVAGIAAII